MAPALAVRLRRVRSSRPAHWRTPGAHPSICRHFTAGQVSLPRSERPLGVLVQPRHELSDRHELPSPAPHDPDLVLFAGRNRLFLSRDGGTFWRALVVELPEIEAVAFA